MIDHSHFAVLLLVLGLALLIAEIFIPSGGLILTASVVCLGFSVYFAWSAWWYSNQTAFWAYVVSLAVLMPVTIVGAFTLVPRTSMGKRILLEAPAPEEVRAYAREQERLWSFVGRGGRTLTLLNPGGLVLLDGERLHCESEGMVVDAGEEVRIVGVKGNRLVVRHEPAGQEPISDRDLEVTEAEKPPLDFDLPQG
jgi:membrane-bound serine protease (ClpP class)